MCCAVARQGRSLAVDDPDGFQLTIYRQPQAICERGCRRSLKTPRRYRQPAMAMVAVTGFPDPDVEQEVIRRERRVEPWGACALARGA